MKALRRVGLLVGGVTASALGLAAPACSGGSSGQGADAASTDSTTDTFVEDTYFDHVTLDATGDAAGDTGDAGPVCANPYDASDLDADSVQEGFELVLSTYRCAPCHQTTQPSPDGGGLTLSGNSIGVQPGRYPSNLTSSPQGVGCFTDAQLLAAILYGTSPEVDGGQLCPPMPLWSQHGMTPEQAQNVVDFLRSLPPSSNVVPPSSCPAMEAGVDAGDAGDGEVDATDASTDAGDAADQ